MPDVARSRLLGALAELDAAHDKARAAMVAAIGEPLSQPEDDVNFSDPKWITASAAAEIADCSDDTIRRWVDRDGIGRQRAGRYFVHLDRLNALLRTRKIIR